MQLRACCCRDFGAFCVKTPRGTVAHEQQLQIDKGILGQYNSWERVQTIMWKNRTKKIC